MPDELIPPSEWMPTSRPGLTAGQRVEAWFELMEIAEQFHLAGLRHKIGPDGDLRAAVQEAYDREMEQHDEMMLNMLSELDRRENNQKAGNGN
jgi:citrate synthase